MSVCRVVCVCVCGILCVRVCFVYCVCGCSLMSVSSVLYVFGEVCMCVCVV